MKTALRRLVRTGRGKLVIALQTCDHPGFFMKRTVENGLRVRRVGDYVRKRGNSFPRDRRVPRG